jgi:superfamily I DNA/RNA helicase
MDEVQDLTAATHKMLKACCRRSLIFAGDADQSIFQSGFSFRRAGIDIAGRTMNLKFNFHNTAAIHDLADRYRAKAVDYDMESQPMAFGVGHIPKIFRAENRVQLLDLIASRVDLFVRILGYDPENIAVLAPLKDDLKLAKEALAAKGFDTVNLHDDDFEFSRTGAVRISTLESSKGLDFPVVLLFIYRQPFFGSSFHEATTDKMTRNLVYVAMTSAMDHLCVFTLMDSKSGAIRDLSAAFE